MKINDYVLCNLGEGNEVIKVQSIDKGLIKGVRPFPINAGTAIMEKDIMFKDKTVREYLEKDCRIYMNTISYRYVLKVF